MKVFLKKELDIKKLLSNREFGFRSDLSTVHAIAEITKIAKEEMVKPYRKRKLCTLITIDIKNAFNSANWKSIDEELKRINISKHNISLNL